MPDRKTYQNETVYLPDLVKSVGPVITATFENCHLLGPAIVVLLSDTSVEGVSFGVENSDPETILWEVPENSFKIGAIGFQDCRIMGGRTEAVGFAGTKDALDKFRNSVRRT